MPAALLVVLGVLFFGAFAAAFVLICMDILIVEVAPLALIALCISYVILGLGYRKCRSKPKNIDKYGVDNIKEETKHLLNVSIVLEGIIIALSVMALILYKMN